MPRHKPLFKQARIDEHTHQALLLQWTWTQVGRYPELEYLHAIPNGAKLPYARTTSGHYSKQAMKLKAEGLKRGVPDLCFPFPRCCYHGLYIEMKALDGEPSEDQIKFVSYLNTQGFLACFTYGWEAGKTVLEWYLEQPPFGWAAQGQVPTEAILTMPVKSTGTNRLSI